MQRWALVAVMLAGLAPATRAYANGGPVDWTGPTLGHGVAPLERTDVALVAEDLLIEFEPDARHYRVRARYLLDNPGTAKDVLFGVPFFRAAALAMRKEMGPPQRGGARWPSQANAMASVEITVGGRRKGCHPGSPRTPASLPRASDEAPPAPDVWCVARIAIPAGHAVPLELRYRGELEFEDGEVSSSAIQVYNERTLRYDFSAAGYWAGHPHELKVSLRLGALAGAPVSADPPAAHSSPEQLDWSFRDVDLRIFKPLTVVVNPVHLLEQRQILSDGAKRRSRARASSTLDPRHAPAAVTDGSAATAWCEGVEGDGVGEWIELAFAPVRRDEIDRPICGLEGVALVPGLGRPGAFLDNGRVRRVRITPCGTSDGGVEREIELDSLPTSSARLLSLQSDPAVTPSMYTCVRLTLLEVAPGRRFRDTCVGALFPVFNCEALSNWRPPAPPF
jgi:hypothetical protein